MMTSYRSDALKNIYFFCKKLLTNRHERYIIDARNGEEEPPRKRRKEHGNEKYLSKDVSHNG